MSNTTFEQSSATGIFQSKILSLSSFRSLDFFGSLVMPCFEALDKAIKAPHLTLGCAMEKKNSHLFDSTSAMLKARGKKENSQNGKQPRAYVSVTRPTSEVNKILAFLL